MRLLQIVIISIMCTSIAVYHGEVTAAGKHKTKAHGRKAKKAVGPGDVWDRVRSGLRIPIPGPSPYGNETLAILPDSNADGLSNTDVPDKSAKTIAATNEKTGSKSSVIIPKKTVSGKGKTSDANRVRQVLTLSKQNETAVIANDSAKSRYTALGRQLLSPKAPKNPSLKQLYKHPDAQTGDAPDNLKESPVFKSATVQRIRTRLGLHPELSKDKSDDNVKLQQVDNVATGTVQEIDEQSNVNDKTSPAKPELVIRGCADFNKTGVIPLVRKKLLSEHYLQMAEQCRLRQNATYARINRQINNYGHDYLQRVAERARPFLFHIVDALSKHNLPMDLALLPIVESAYQPTALSSASAAGIWQFIPSTGKVYGLTQTEEYDARLDVASETQAAIRFLSGLRDHYHGDWLLALAAYNAGPGTVDAAINRNIEAGLGGDYWSLELPEETQNYVPRLLALSSIFRYSGLKLRPVLNQAHFIKASIEDEAELKQIISKDLNSVAKLANFDASEFAFMNAAYLKGKVPHGKPITFLLPVKNANQLHQSLAYLAQSASQDNMPSLSGSVFFSQSLQFKHAMPLLSIALNSVRQESHLNSLRNQPDLATEPLTQINTKSALEKGGNSWSVHYLDAGETLKSLAEEYGVSEEKLREINNFKRRQKTVFGQRIVIPVSFLALEARKKTHPSILFNS